MYPFFYSLGGSKMRRLSPTAGAASPSALAAGAARGSGGGSGGAAAAAAALARRASGASGSCGVLCENIPKAYIYRLKMYPSFTLRGQR